MAKPSQPRTRTVLEPLSHLDLSNHSRSPVRSLAVFTVSDSQTLIYAGTHSGTLLLLSANPNYSNSHTTSDNSNAPLAAPQNLSLLRSVSVGDASVDSVLVFGETGKVLALSGGFLFLLDSLLLQPVKKLSVLRGVSVITRRMRSSEAECSSLTESVSNSSEHGNTSQRFLQKWGSGIRANGLKIKEQQEQHREGNHVFAVLVGKKLILVELVLGSRVGKNDRDGDGVSGSIAILKEIQCIDGVWAMVWLNDSIIVGTVNGYSLFSCVTGQSGVIFSLPDVSSRPQLKLLCKDWNVLLLVDNLGVIVNAHGQPVAGSLVFSSGPDSIGEISLYVVVVRDGKMDLYHKKSGSCIQTITFGGEGVGGPCFVADGEDGNGKLVVVATPTKVCKYNDPELLFQIAYTDCTNLDYTQ